LAEVTEVVKTLTLQWKALDIVGLLWLTRLVNVTWSLGTVPVEWQTGVVVPIFKKGDRGTMDQLFTLAWLLGGAWELAHPVYMCFVDFEKAYDRLPRGILWGLLREYGVPGPLVRAIRSLYKQSESCVRIVGTKSSMFSVVLDSAKVVPCHRFCL